MRKIFGTDGVRGKANRYPMTPEVALKLGQAIAYHFSNRKGGGRIVIGKDTRRSSYMFEYALSAGISSMGSVAILTGPLPTPGIAFITNAMRADAGVVISASHNLFQDNGIKFFDREGFKLPDEIELQMEEFIEKKYDDSTLPEGAAIGRAFRVDDAVGRYAEFIKSTFPHELTLQGLKIAVDCAHGASYKVAPLVLSEMDAEVIATGIEPNGININDRCGALYPTHISDLVKKEKAHVGIALDGDADRVILCDETGKVIDGDAVLALCAVERLKQGKLNHKTVVGTTMTNMGLEIYLREQGIRMVRTSVGDRYIMEEMRKNKYTLGGEPSGHLIFLDLATTGDGLVAALQVLACMIQTQKPLSEIIPKMPIFPQKTCNIAVKNKKDLSSVPQLKQEVEKIEKELIGKGRLVVRYSGTEPLIRLTVEAENEALIERYLNHLSESVHKYLA